MELPEGKESRKAKDMALHNGEGSGQDVERNKVFGHEKGPLEGLCSSRN